MPRQSSPELKKPVRKYILSVSIESCAKATKKAIAAEVKNALEASYAFAGAKVRVRTVDVD